MVRLIMICLMAHLLTMWNYGQEIISTTSLPCYVDNLVVVPDSVERVEAILGKQLNINKNIDSAYVNGRVYYFYKEILWRIEVKNAVLDCPYTDGIYFDNDIKVVSNGTDTSVTSMTWWGIIVRSKPTYKKESAIKRKRIGE